MERECEEGRGLDMVVRGPGCQGCWVIRVGPREYSDVLS